MEELIREFFQYFTSIEKPKKNKIGGTYYGSTELISTVGNMLEEINGEYVAYDSYGGKTVYTNVYAIKIGGAYRNVENYSEKRKVLLDELIKLNGGRYNYVSKCGIIDKYGTNFSVVGFGYILH